MAFITHKYGAFKDTQMAFSKRKLRKSIFFLLLCVDPKTKDEYKDIDINQTIDNVLHRINGLNKVLFYPQEIVTIVSLLQEAKDEFNKPEFDFMLYRKLILDAGAEVLKIRERDIYAEL